MKASWQVKTLDETCLFSNGLWKGAKAPLVNIGVIRNTNFSKDGTLDDSDIAYLDVEAKKFEKRRLQFGDIILEKSGGGPKQAVGRVALFDKKEGDFSFSNFTSAIRVREPQELDFRFLHKFLYWSYLSGVTEEMQSHSTGIRNLDGNAYKAIKIALPTLPEQKRIVSILDEAFGDLITARANAGKNIRNARELFEGHLQSKLAKRPGWEGKTLKQVSLDFGRGKSKHRPRNDAKLYGGPYPFIQTGDVRACEHLITDFTQTYSETGLAQSKLWPKGTLCITIAANIAETGILGFDSCFPDSVIGVVVDPTQTSNSFLEYLLQSVKASLKAKGKGSAQDNINLATFENEPFYFPDLAEQKQIVDQLSDLNAEVQRLESIYRKKLAALDELKKSLLHRAFSGQL